MSTSPTTEDRIMRLDDGRLLCYREFGDFTGYPVFLFHGIPGSRCGAGYIADAAAAREVRVISIDRPGIGFSSYQPNRTFLDWPHDVTQLADALRLDRFGVVGNSGGCAYALACGVIIPERLEFLGIVSGMGTPDHPDWMEWMRLPRFERVMIALARRAPTLACRIAGPVLVREFDPRRDGVIERMKRAMSDFDALLLDDPMIAGAVLCDAAEAIRQGPLGVTWDIMLYTQPWGFRLSDVKVPVHLWHGDADITVPPIFARAMEAELNDCIATFWPGEGHLMAAPRAGDIIDTINETLTERRNRHSSQIGRPLPEHASTSILDAALNSRHPEERRDHAGIGASRATSTDQGSLPRRSNDGARHDDRARNDRSRSNRVLDREPRRAN